MKTVILDMDAGVDDALAIMLLVRSPELQLHAITAVSGNVHVDKTSSNALKILEALGVSHIPVSKGMAKPLLRNLDSAEEYHGKDGLGDSGLPAPKLHLDRRHAVDLLLQETTRDRGKITVLATGPLTNIATALLREPRFAQDVKELVIMGGAYALTPYGYGNTNPVAEYNIYVDPEAAKVVFQSGIPLTAVGLDVTTNPTAALTLEIHRKIEQSTSDSARLAVKITKQGLKNEIFHLHDPMAAAFVIDPTIFTTKKYHVDVETVSSLARGQTIVDRRDWLPQETKQPLNASICTSVDGPRFLSLFTQRIAAL